MKTENICFVFLKDEKIKILNIQEVRQFEKDLLLDGWKHTATINPAVVLEYLYNTDDLLEVNWSVLHNILTT